MSIQAKDSVWVNSDGLAVGFGTRAKTTTGGFRLSSNGATEKLFFRFVGTDLAASVAAADDQIVYGPVIPNGATILSSTLKVSTAFTSGGSATLDIGLYDKDGAEVDANGLDAAVAVAALTLGAEIAGDGLDVNTVVATSGGVKVGVSYNTAAFTAGEAVLEVEYMPA